MRKLNPGLAEALVQKNQAKINKMMYKQFAQEQGTDKKLSRKHKMSKDGKRLQGLIDIVD